MKVSATTGQKRAGLFGLLSLLAFASVFFLVPLGGFTLWITVGATVYFVFMTIYSLVPPPARPARRVDPKKEELREYVRYHLRMLLYMFLAAAFFVMIFLWFTL